VQAETKEAPRELGVHDHSVRGEGTSDDIELESIWDVTSTLHEADLG